jgi:Zn-dependent protease
MDTATFFLASWPIGRWGHSQVRLSIWLVFFAIFLALQELLAKDPGMTLVVLVGLPLVMLLHTLAHLAAVRAVGGACPVAILGPLNESADYDLPIRPRAHFVVALAGPLASGLVAVGLWLLGPVLPPGSLVERGASWGMQANAWVAIINLLACSVFDGARLWRGVLWPLFGLPRAVRTTIVLAYGSAAALVVGGVLGHSLLLAMMGVLCLAATVQESRSIALGFDPVLQTGVGELRARGGSTWWSRWQARRLQHAQERLARREAAEQATLDRLLAKVSAHGLPSLTRAERAMLKQISVQQQQRRADQGR